MSSHVAKDSPVTGMLSNQLMSQIWPMELLYWWAWGYGEGEGEACPAALGGRRVRKGWFSKHLATTHLPYLLYYCCCDLPHARTKVTGAGAPAVCVLGQSWRHLVLQLELSLHAPCHNCHVPQTRATLCPRLDLVHKEPHHLNSATPRNGNSEGGFPLSSRKHIEEGEIFFPLIFFSSK